MSNYTGLRGQFVQTGDPTTVNETTPYAPGQLGKEVTVTNTSGSSNPGQGAKVFKYVQVDSGAPVVPSLGAVAWWLNRDNFIVTTYAGNRGQVAGVFCAATPNVGNCGYIQIGGPAMVNLVFPPTAVPTNAGMFVIPSATDAKADCLAAGSAATYQPLGTTSNTTNYDGANARCEVILKQQWNDNQ